jgi:anaerobic ribonucleoside-triphosphate reductase
MKLKRGKCQRCGEKMKDRRRRFCDNCDYIEFEVSSKTAKMLKNMQGQKCKK